MTDRPPMTVRVDSDAKKRLDDFVNSHFDKTHGKKGDVVSQAIHDYIDSVENGEREGFTESDRELLEEIATTVSDGDRLDTHTTPQQGGDGLSQTYTTAKAIAEELQDVYNDTVQTKDVIREIEKRGGGNKQTIREYKKRLKRHALMFEHPGEPSMWFFNKEVWFNQVDAALRSGEDMHDIFEPYPSEVKQQYISDDELDKQAVADGGGDD